MRYSIIAFIFILTIFNACDDPETFPVYYKINNQSDFSLTFIGYSYSISTDKIENDTIELQPMTSELFSTDLVATMNRKKIFKNYLTFIYDSIKIEIEDQVVKNFQHGSPIFNIDNWEFIQNEESFDAYYYLTNDSLDL